jgi:hypothetical protein
MFLLLAVAVNFLFIGVYAVRCLEDKPPDKDNDDDDDDRTNIPCA